ncbi:RSP_2648 family PIN domain-containing protein [Pontivivens insulae]|uniref:PIN domain-containing protein n=1 Tax=Pontivivens insulae TaxID=1639689 RepID=A0A2R8A9L8_9RHOB|nr:PIN domain-containing protein [Pontivivens insulae]RED12815.1 putative nucleic acid-binding protein [Pontivivens insulae]SPF28906.1 hypothetical protein POI8812_01209 [Pontivivens insulae]
MRAVLDACVLYPTIQREILLSAAARGDFEPIWSARLLEEWRRAAARAGAAVEAQARVEIALVEARFPAANQLTPPRDDLWLPDLDDIHVLATALESKANLIVTRNLKDFPPRVLAGHQLTAQSADSFLLELHLERSLAVEVEAVRAEAERLSGEDQPLRPLLKRAGLPRLAKALAG